MKTNRFLWLSLLALALAFFACDKDKDPKPTEKTCVVNRITDEDGDVTSSYEYDDALRVTRFELGPEYYFTFFYSGDKVIINFYNFGEVTQITATLDDEGRLEEWIEDSGLERYYYYNSQGYLQEMESYNPDDDDESFTIYYTVANGNVVSAIQEFEDGSIGTIAYTYFSDKLNKDGILHFETDGILHMGFNRQGKASKNLLKSEVRTSPDQEVRRWDMTYVLQTDGYVSQRNAEYTNVDINWTFVQNFQYNCQ